MTMEIHVHGSPYDRGSADAYYGRPQDPHYWPDGTGNGERIEIDQMTHEEIVDYELGYEEMDDRKDWN